MYLKCVEWTWKKRSKKHFLLSASHADMSINHLIGFKWFSSTTPVRHSWGFPSQSQSQNTKANTQMVLLWTMVALTGLLTHYSLLPSVSCNLLCIHFNQLPECSGKGCDSWGWNVDKHTSVTLQVKFAGASSPLFNISLSLNVMILKGSTLTFI